jgi:hypothetical protein
MRNRPLIIIVSLVFLAVSAGGLFAEDEKVTLPDSPLVDEKEKAKEAAPPAAEEKPAGEKKAAEPPAPQFLVPGSMYIGLHAGGAFSLGGFEEQMGAGLELFFTIKYQFTPNISAAGAISMFSLYTADGNAAIGFYHMYLDGRYHLPLNEKFYGYFQLGASFYTGNFADFSFGFNGGVGAGWIVLPDMALELGVDYNATFKMENMFLQVYIGADFKM